LARKRGGEVQSEGRKGGITNALRVAEYKCASQKKTTTVGSYPVDGR
jgi:hypothetical protein